jgi:CRP-like cAMP-binding protein
MRKTEIVAALKDVPLLRGLSDKELTGLARFVREDTFKAGEDIVTEGDSGGPFYLIISGEARAIVDGRSRGLIGPGQSFGEISLIDRGPRSATIRASTEVMTLAISSWNFLSMLEENWKLAHKIMIELCRQIRTLDKRVG